MSELKEFTRSAAHIDRPHSLWAAALGTGRSIQTCNVWADSARKIEQLPSFGSGEGKAAMEREEISAIVTMSAYGKMAGIKVCHFHTYLEVMGLYTFTLTGDKTSYPNMVVVKTCLLHLSTSR